MDKDLKKIVKALTEQGFDVTITNKQHVIVTNNGLFVTAFAGTVSDHRGYRNSISAARKHGFEYPPKR